MVEQISGLRKNIQTMSKRVEAGKLEKKKVSRPGVHSKTKTSKLKTSKNYKKTYKSQGR